MRSKSNRFCWCLLSLIWLGTTSAGIAEDAAPPDPEAVRAVEELGGSVAPVAQNDPRLDVTLHLANQEVTDEILPMLAKLDNVVWLNLAGTKITDEGLQAISEMKSLEKLHLEKTGIGDAAMQHLVKLENLTYLNLYDTHITDEGLQTLAPLKKLRKLFVWQTHVTPEGIAALKEKLPELTVISGVDEPPQKDETQEPPAEEESEEE